jgi:NADPH:quinone reductase
MRALHLKEYVGPAGLELVEPPAPEPAPDVELVDVRALGVNFPRPAHDRGQYQFRPHLSTVPGGEVAGQVVRGPQGSGWSTGERSALVHLRR